MKQNDVFELIKLSLWGEGNPTVDLSVYQEMKNQAIAALPAPVLSSLDLPPELMKEWRNVVFQQIAMCTNYLFIQTHLPIDVPYVILKGSSAAQYYPYPEYRALGDIDIITRREDYDSSCETMLKNGWSETTSRAELERGRHRSFTKAGTIVEIHAFFASMNDVKKAKAFDDLVISNITENHILPDLINGLVLLDHVNQHMEHGIGLKQIIDWMMFVDKCLADDNWNTFERLVAQTGLKELAITTISGLYQLRHPIMTIKELQQKGLENASIKRNPILRPFAWITEGWRRIIKTPDKLEKYRYARRTNALFMSLGVSRSADGLVLYEDGRYFKKQ